MNPAIWPRTRCGSQREGSNHATTLSGMAYKLILRTEPRVLAARCADAYMRVSKREKKGLPLRERVFLSSHRAGVNYNC